MPQVHRGGHVRAVAEGDEPAVGRVVQRVRGTSRRQHGQHRHGDQARDEQYPRAHPGSAVDGQQPGHHTAGAEQRGQPERVGDQVRGHVPDQDLPGWPGGRHHQGWQHPAAAHQGHGDHDQDGDTDPGRGHHGEAAAAAWLPGSPYQIPAADSGVPGHGRPGPRGGSAGPGTRHGRPGARAARPEACRAAGAVGKASGSRAGISPVAAGVAAHCPLAVGRGCRSGARRRRRPARAENS